MKKLLKLSFTAIAFTLIISMSAFAHSGRTDANGGHRDNKNVSGLGYYHYHHGYSAHLHPNGICPYASPASQPTEPSVTKNVEKTSLSDIKAYLNGNFIPSFNYNGATYIVAESLDKYGFDIDRDENSRDLSIKRNIEKSIEPSLSENPTETYEIQNTDITAYLYDEATGEFAEILSYNIGGQTIIQLSSIGNTSWDSSARTISVSI